MSNNHRANTTDRCQADPRTHSEKALDLIADRLRDVVLELRVGRIPDTLAEIADHHECALPATWDDDGARPVEGEHGWVTPLLPDGSQRYPDGTPVEMWSSRYADRARFLFYVARDKYAPMLGGTALSWPASALVRPVLPPTAPACDRDHADDWVAVDGDTVQRLLNGTQVRTAWVKGGGPTSPTPPYLVRRDDLSDSQADERVKAVARVLAEKNSNNPTDIKRWLTQAKYIIDTLDEIEG